MGNYILQQVEFDHYTIWDFEYNGQGHLANDESVFIKKNIVYREVLNI